MTKGKTSVISGDLVKQIKMLLVSARQKVVRQINLTMIHTYAEIGRIIVEEEQKGENRAAYRKAILTYLSNELTEEFGKGFSVDNLERMRKFYQMYADRISASVVRISEDKPSSLTELQLSWTHYLRLMQIDNKDERQFYSDTLVKITLPEDNKQIFASKYQTVLPSKKQLKELIEERNS